MIKRESLSGPFEVHMPEIYQVELSSACDFNCVMCPRNYHSRYDKKAFFDKDLLQVMMDRGDFAGSYFVELQMSGEPLLHPQFNEIVKMMKEGLPGITLGLSTNGSKIQENIEGLKLLDYITVSVDSMNAEKYESIRVGGDFSKLLDGIEYLIHTLDFDRTTLDLQAVELPGWEEEIITMKNVFNEDVVNIRSVPDCSITFTDEVDELPVKTDYCLNPWMSVSVQSNGNVVPCCFCFSDHIILGNVADNTIEEIWRGDKIKELRKEHQDRNYNYMCSRCYMRSPTLLHWNLFCESIRRK